MTNPEAVRVLAEARSIATCGPDTPAIDRDLDEAAWTIAALPEGWALVNLAALRAEVEGLVVPLSYPNAADGTYIQHDDNCIFAYGNTTYPCWCFVLSATVLAILDRLAKPDPEAGDKDCERCRGAGCSACRWSGRAGGSLADPPAYLRKPDGA